jgi:P27 family predicted phage terminase small subunit
MVGRKNKPIGLKLLEGNTGHRPLPENEPKPEADLPPCPDYLKDDEYAFNEWNRITPELYKLGLLTVVDHIALELYCSQYSIYRQALEIIDSDGLITTNIRNGDKANPATTMARESAKIIKSLCAEFGLTQSSRGRISLPGGKEEESPMRKLWNKKRA